MTDVHEFERRIADALSQIRSALDQAAGARAERAASPGPQPALTGTPAHDALVIALEDERLANAQLNERLRVLKERNDQRVAEVQHELARATARLVAVESELQTMRQSQAELRDIASQLRAAAAQNLTEPDLVNRALVAEVEALRVARSADLAEVDAVIAELRPIVEGAR